MNRWKTHNNYEIFQVLSGRSNAYLIVAERHNILVDTGKTFAFKKLNSNIRSLNLSQSNISYLILTHLHFDHCQNAAILKQHENCKVIASIEEKNNAENGFGSLPNGTNPMTKLIIKIGKSIGKNLFGFQPFTPDIFVDKEYCFMEPELNIRIIETKGHSEGSLSIIVDDEIAIVGDALFGMFRHSVFPPYADDQKEMIKSWGKLLNTNCKVFLPGHGSEIQRSLLQKEYNKYSHLLNSIDA